MKKTYLVFCMLIGIALAMPAQNVDDDLYYVPKKSTAKPAKTTTTASQATASKTTTSVTDNTPTTARTVVIRNANGEERNVDEYNRRYTSRDNTFNVENDTLYITEKTPDERGEWVNGFNGDEADYEYATRILRFRSPRYGIPVSSPLYWDVVYSLPYSWDWNVYDDGTYAYLIPSRHNLFYWDWYTSAPFFGWGWGSPWHYSSWYWNCGWYDPWFNWGYGWHHYGWHHYGWYGGWHHGIGWGGGYAHHHWYGSSALRPGLHAGRYVNNYGNRRNASIHNGSTRGVTGTGRNSRSAYTRDRNSQVSHTGTGTRSVRNNAREVRGSVDSRTAVRSRSVTNGTRTNVGGESRTRSTSNYSRSTTDGRRPSYNRPSSTRSTATNGTGSSSRSSRSSATSTRNSRSYSGGGNSRSYSSGSSSRSYSGGGSSRSYSGGGGSRSYSGGGGSHTGGGGHRR